MQKKFVINYLLENLQQDFNDAGFKGQTKYEWLIKEQEDYNLIFKLFIYKHATGYKVEPHIWIQSKAVEEIYRRITFVDKRHQNNTFTIGGSVGVLMEPENEGDVFRKNTILDFYFNNTESLEGALDFLKYCFNNAALDYFQTNANLQMIDSLLNDSPQDLSIHSIIYPIRCTKGIIVAKLIGRKNYSSLVEAYSKELVDANKQYVDEFERARDLLMDINLKNK